MSSRLQVGLLLLLLCLGSYSSAIAQSYNYYQSEPEAATKADRMKFTEIAIPADFSKGDLLTVKLVFTAKSNPKKVLGYVSQQYRIQTSHDSGHSNKKYLLEKEGKTQYVDQHGIIGLLDDLILQKGTTFHYQVNTSLTDDLVYAFLNFGGETNNQTLMYVGMDKPSTLSKADQFLLSLIEEEEPAPATTPSSPVKEKENTNTSSSFIPEVNIDTEAYFEERDYDVFVLNSDQPTKRDGHLIQLGFYVPVELGLGKIMRVLALKKAPNSGDVLGMMELDYYVDEIAIDNGLTIYMLQDLRDLSISDGDFVKLSAKELEAFGGSKSI
ncbi:MAG: hypothetical protein AAFV80_04985, partial [Bacteroidota bacterium]